MGCRDRHGALYKFLSETLPRRSRPVGLEAMGVSTPSSAESSQFNRFNHVDSSSNSGNEVHSYSVLSHENGGFRLQCLCIESEPRRASSKRAHNSAYNL